MAVAECITNLLAAPIDLSRVKLSANWMAACGESGEDAALYRTVETVGLELCPALGISIPVGKDSLSMRTQWKTEQGPRQVTSPVSLIVSGFVSLDDVRGSWTPQLNADVADTSLVLVDLGQGQHRMGGSILEQWLNQQGRVSHDRVPDLDQAQSLLQLARALNELRGLDLVLEIGRAHV